MLGSPSFHSYRDARTGSGRPDLELGSGIYYEDPAYTVRVHVISASFIFFIFVNAILDFRTL